jgi:RND family efflux transporter MFP subunit
MPTERSEQNELMTHETQLAPAPKRPRKPKYWVMIVLVALIAGAAALGILPRIKESNTVRAETADMTVQSVTIVHPLRSSPEQEIVLPANIQSYTTAPIFARTSGYLKKWYFDIGAHVKKGQLLAVIETPELDQQLQQARGMLATAQANLRLAQITADRYTNLIKTNSVTQQETDNAVGTLKANQATVQQYQANVRQLEQLQSYERVYAPFDGVINQRNTDIGQLITAGSSGGPQAELFQMVKPDILRVYVNVPQAYSQSARPGMTADLVLQEFPGRRFTGKLVRTADAIDPVTRTLLVEIQVDNRSGTLFTGSYAEVHFKVGATSPVYVLPVETLLFRHSGLHVATVVNGQTLIKTVMPGRDFGDRIEILSGLNGDESVIVNPEDSIANGEKVKIVGTTQVQNKLPAGGSK